LELASSVADPGNGRSTDPVRLLLRGRAPATDYASASPSLASSPQRAGSRGLAMAVVRASAGSFERLPVWTLCGPFAVKVSQGAKSAVTEAAGELGQYHRKMYLPEGIYARGLPHSSTFVGSNGATECA
jgi:hypothetical protein